MHRDDLAASRRELAMLDRALAFGERGVVLVTNVDWQELGRLIAEPPAVDSELDAASARRVIAALRREQHARDGYAISQAWKALADRIERSYPTDESVSR